VEDGSSNGVKQGLSGASAASALPEFTSPWHHHDNLRPWCDNVQPPNCGRL